MLGVTIDYLLGHEDAMPPAVPAAEPLPASRQRQVETREVPIVSWAQAGDLVAYSDLDDALARIHRNHLPR